MEKLFLTTLKFIPDICPLMKNLKITYASEVLLLLKFSFIQVEAIRDEMR
jgi:hypothetical protein